MTKFGKYLVCGVAVLTLAGIGVASAKIGIDREVDGTLRLKANLQEASRSVLDRIENVAMTPDGGPVFDEEYVADRATIFFEPDSASLTPQALETLSMFANFVENTGYTGLVIKGHTDGEEVANSDVDLSHRRAMTVLTALVDSGLRIDEHKRLSIEVNGAPAAPPPLESTATDNGDLMNSAERRVDVIVRHDTPPFPISDATGADRQPADTVTNDGEWFDQP